jgi:hypothetical protein
MSAPTTVSPSLLADTCADARNDLAAARSTDIHDHLALVASHATLTAMVARILWTLDEERAS